MKRTAANAALVVTSTALGLAGFEVGLRAYYGNPSPFLYPQVRHVPVRPYGYKLAPNQSGTFTLDKPVRSNANGFRGGAWPAVHDTSVGRVMVIGDSFTFGNNVREEHTYAARLEHHLRAERRNVAVLNAGVGGWNIDNEAEFFASEGITYRPDVVVLGFYSNDFQYPVTSVYVPTMSTDARLESRPWWLRWVPYRVLFWVKRSALVVYLRDRILVFDQPSDNVPERLLHNRIDFQRDPFIGFTYAQILRIRDSAAAHGAPMLVAVLPGVDTFWVPKGSLQWVDSLRAFTTRNDIAFADMADGFWTEAGNRQRFFGYPWDNHFVASGHEIVARQLTPLVSALLDSSRARPKRAPGARR